jgi:hypothetical protein
MVSRAEPRNRGDGSGHPRYIPLHSPTRDSAIGRRSRNINSAISRAFMSIAILRAEGHADSLFGMFALGKPIADTDCSANFALTEF